MLKEKKKKMSPHLFDILCVVRRQSETRVLWRKRVHRLRVYTSNPPPILDTRFKEITTYLLGIRAILGRSNAHVSWRKHSRVTLKRTSVYFAYIYIYIYVYNVYVCAWPESWHELRGRSCFQIWKFNTFLRRETRPHTEGRRQTEIPAEARESTIIFFSESLRPGINATAKPVVCPRQNGHYAVKSILNYH